KRVAVTFCVAGRIPRELRRAAGVRPGILDDDLGRRRGVAVQELVRRLLVPGEAGAAALELEQQLVLTSYAEGAEGGGTGSGVVEREQQRCVVFESPARHERPEICEHFHDAGVGDVLREVE